MTPEDFERWPLPFPDDLKSFDYESWGDGKREETSFSLHDAHLNSVVSKMIAPMSDCGLPKNLEEFVRYMQTAHGILLQYANDWFRSRWPDCTTSMSWMFNAPEPNTLCWSIVDYYGVPKRAYYYQKRSYAPLHAVATGFDVSMPKGETFRAKLAVINETAEEYKDVALKAKLYDSTFKILCEDERIVSVEKEQVNLCGYFSYEVPKDAKDEKLFLVVELKDGKKLLDRSVYCPGIGEYSEKVKFFGNGPYISDAEKTRGSVSASLEKKDGGFVLSVTNTGSVPLYEVSVAIEEEENVVLSDNYFWLDVGETKTIEAVGETASVGVYAWNADRTEVATENDKGELCKKKGGGTKKHEQK